MIKIDNFVKLRPFMQRYTRLVKLDDRFNMNLQWVRQHSNKLILFGITRQHPIVEKNLSISSVKYHILGNDMDQLADLVIGKRKSNEPIQI